MSMIRNLADKGIAFVRNANLPTCYNPQLVADTGALDSGTNYATFDFLHTGILVFNDVFQLSSDAVITIDSVVIKERITSGTLLKPALELLFFTDYGDLTDANVVKNTAFAFTAGFTLAMIKDRFTVASTDYAVIAGLATDAICIKNNTNKVRLEQTGVDRNLYAIAVYTSVSASKFDVSVLFDIGINVTCE